MAQVRPGRAVLEPNLGLYLGQPPITVPERGLVDCLNVRIKQRRIVRDNLGWSTFDVNSSPLNLDGKPVLLIDQFDPRNGSTRTIFGNTTDLFALNIAETAVEYLTPRYQTGTVNVTNGDATVVGVGTTWTTNLKPGDFIHVGAIDQVSMAATWYQVLSITNDTSLELTTLYTGATDTGLAYTGRQTFTGTLRTPWQSEPFYAGINHTVGADGDRWYATNGLDKVAAWDGTDDKVYLLSDLDNVGFLRADNNSMIYGNIQVSGDKREFKVRTSAIGEPENVTTLEAAEFTVHSGSDPLLTAERLGDLLAIYGERSITLMQFVGQPVGYVFRTVVEGFGPRSSRAVAQFGDFHLFVGADSQYRFDGVSVTEINTHVWREITRTMSPQRLDMLHSHFDEEQGELLWVTPLNTDADPDEGAPEHAFTHHYLEDVGERNPDAYSRRELPATAFGFFQSASSLTWNQLTQQWNQYNIRWNDQQLQEAFPQVLFGDAGGNVFVLNDSNLKNGAALTSRARFSRRPLGDIRTKGFLSRVYPFVEQLTGSSDNLKVRTWKANTVDGPASLHASLDYPLGDPGRAHFVNPRLAARYLEVEFYTDTYSGYWAVAGYNTESHRASGA